MTNNNFPKQVIDNIRSQFTGDKKKDRQIILTSMDKYRDDTNSQEIIHELSRLLVDYLTPEEIEGFERAFKQDNPERVLYDDVMDDFNNQRIGDAFNKLDDYVRNAPKRFVDDENVEYHVVGNKMEAVLFEKYVECEREVRFLPPNVPLTDIYYLYSFLLVERNEFQAAEKYLKIALNYNPVSCSFLFELIDLYKRMFDWENMDRYLKLAFKYAYAPDLLARAYRDLGFYHIEKGNLDVAVALYIHSLKFDNHDAAHQELAYLEHNGQNVDYSVRKVQKILEDNDIPLVANSFIVKEYRGCGDSYAEEDNLEAALEMYALAYALDDSLENQMRYKMAEATLNGEGSVNITL